MTKVKNTYPDWAEKFRGKGKTIRKVRGGYGLYECTSEYVKGSKYPKSKQTYLGMITEKDGFIPKKTETDEPIYLEYGLSHLARLNFKSKAMHHVYHLNDDLFKLGVIHFVFGVCDDLHIRASYLTYADADSLIELCSKLKAEKIGRVGAVISDAFNEKVPEAEDRQKIRDILKLAVVESGPRSVRKPGIPPEIRELLDRLGLKYTS